MIPTTERILSAIKYDRPSKITACVYQIVSFKSGRTYVGLTEDFTNRMRHHAAELAAGRHKNFAMQADYNAGHTFHASILRQFSHCGFSVNKEPYRRVEAWYILRLGAIEKGYNTHANWKTIEKAELMALSPYNFSKIKKDPSE